MASQPIQRDVTTTPILPASSTKVWVLVATEPLVEFQEDLLFAGMRLIPGASMPGISLEPPIRSRSD